MNIFKDPSWIREFLYDFSSYEDIPENIYEKINGDLETKTSDHPVVSIIIPAFNEELNILSCVASLSKSETKIPFEIIVVNNNSTDNTQNILEKLKIRSFNQSIIGPGAARQLGQENALGSVVLTADADCIYPRRWIDLMYNNLMVEGTSCVYGRYSFISTDETPRWQLFIYEKMKDILSELRHFKRPHLNSLGMSMGYIKELGLKVGFDTRNVVDENGSLTFVRGEDGRLCFDLSQYGTVRQVKDNNARLWTFQRTINKEGNLWSVLCNRVKKELSKLSSYFSVHPPHNTKQSEN